jgi:predicted permease
MNDAHRDLAQLTVVTVLETLRDEVRFGLRCLRKSPGYTAAAVLTLALGMGANTAIFTLVNGVLLRPLPVREPSRLVTVNQKWKDRTVPFISAAEWRQVQQRPHLFERACAFQALALNLSRRGQVDNAWGLIVTGGYFETLGVRAILGRALEDADDRPGGGTGGPAAVISHRFWQARFGGAVDVIGRSIHIERAPYTIVGVMPPDFHGTGPFAFDLAIPVATVTRPGERQDQVDRSLYLTLIARLRKDQTISSAGAELAAAAPGILAAVGGPPREWVLAKGHGDAFGIARQYRRPLLAMIALAGLVLLIVCVSVANLSLARAAARHQEMSVRRALGASRLRLARQALVENSLLAIAGAGLGLLFARWFSPLVARQVATTYRPIQIDLSLDWRILAFTAAAGTVAALLSGIVPALRASRVHPHAAMASGGRGQMDIGRMRAAHTLVAVQVALSLALVVAAGLFVRTFHTLATMDLGFARDEILIVRVEGEQSRVPPTERAALNERVREAVAAVPGVARAVSLRTVPVSPDHWVADVEVSGRTPAAGSNRTAFLNSVSPGWFAMFGTPVLAGREIDGRDRPGTELVAVVNEAFARQFAGGQNLLGETLRFGGDGEFGPPFTIVGLVRDSGAAIYFGIREGVPPTVYLAFAQRAPGLSNFTPLVTFRLGVTAAGGPVAPLAREVTRAIERVDPDLKTSVRTMSDYVDATVTQERLAAVVAGLFGTLALVLAAVGLYGVTAHAVSRRRTEIGVRLALGASPGGVVRSVLKPVVLLVGTGILLGGAFSYWTSRFAAAMLFGLEPHDPVTFVGASTVLAGIALAAGWLPARRAARIDPAIALRSE